MSRIRRSLHGPYVIAAVVGLVVVVGLAAAFWSVPALAPIGGLLSSITP